MRIPVSGVGVVKRLQAQWEAERKHASLILLVALYGEQNLRNDAAVSVDEIRQRLLTVGREESVSRLCKLLESAKKDGKVHSCSNDPPASNPGALRYVLTGAGRGEAERFVRFEDHLPVSQPVAV